MKLFEKQIWFIPLTIDLKALVGNSLAWIVVVKAEISLWLLVPKASFFASP